MKKTSILLAVAITALIFTGTAFAAMDDSGYTRDDSMRSTTTGTRIAPGGGNTDSMSSGSTGTSYGPGGVYDDSMSSGSTGTSYGPGGAIDSDSFTSRSTTTAPGYDTTGSATGGTTAINLDNLKNFQKETLSMRDDLILKRADLANEMSKATPDTVRLNDLQNQIIDIQAKIQKAAVRNGLTATGWGLFHGPGMGMGMMGHGMGMQEMMHGMYGSGCGGYGY